MRILFLHRNFPSQFVHVATALAARGHDVVAIAHSSNKHPDVVPTVRYQYTPASAGNHPVSSPYVFQVARARAVTDTMLSLRAQSFNPDLVVGHPGWGETLFVKDVWPSAKLIVYAEYYHRFEGADVGFDPEFAQDDITVRHRIRAKNAAMLLSLVDSDRAVTATGWQASRFPDEFRPKLVTLHEGVDTDSIRPNPAARIAVGSRIFNAGEELVTYVSRNLEPYRGYHVFMRALPAILEARPNAHAVIVGGAGASYGERPPRSTWKDIFFDEVKARLPLERVHFVGRIAHPKFIALMQTSAVHVYLTYPFILSWSMLEAMSAGAYVIGSKTPPVEEVIAHGKNGILVDFFDQDTLTREVVTALASSFEDRKPLREAARQTILERYDLRRECLPRWIRLTETVARQ